jgi:peptidase M28-like protein
MRWSPPFKFALLCSPFFAAAACGSSGPNEFPLPEEAELEFDQDRAWSDLEFLVDSIGARRIGTSGSQQTREYIRGELEKLGWVFEEDQFEAQPPEGANRRGSITGTNLIARWAGSEPGEVWVASHYDSFDRPKFIGANDGGSSTAVLIELGRQLALTPGQARSGPGITLVWFDGEEPFYPVPWDDDNNSTFGSRHLAQRLLDEGRQDEVLCLLLLDLVGDKQLGLLICERSTHWLKSLVRTTANDLEMDHIIVGSREFKDDHRPFLKRGIPAIDLIDFRYPNASNDYWHSEDDTLDKCSAASLGLVGRLTLALLPRLAEEGQRQRIDR